jgi:peptide chain release factor 2
MNDTEKKIKELEEKMAAPDFWQNKEKAQATIRELQQLKGAAAFGGGAYDAGAAIITIFSGAGGDDSEDFSRLLFNMYRKYIERQGWQINILHQNENDHGGFRNLTFEINGKNVYGTLKNESGVHRLVRLSPFNAKKLRHTSFSMVEVIPKFEKVEQFKIPEEEMEITYQRSSGPGGQNVNKRETSVRILHKPTKIAVHIDSERSQAQNKEKALAILAGKIYTLREQERTQKEKGMYISKTTDAEWGNQIRSYVMHPYKMVKDHRTNVEKSSIGKVLDGHLDDFLAAEKGL